MSQDWIASCALEPNELRQQIVDEARKWNLTPWKDKGRGPTGIDCVGLPLMVARALKLIDESFNPGNYPQFPDGTFLLKFNAAGAREKPLAEARVGDILIIAQSNRPFHCGIITIKHSVPHIIHANARARKVIEEPITHIQEPIVGCYAFPGF